MGFRSMNRPTYQGLAFKISATGKNIAKGSWICERERATCIPGFGAGCTGVELLKSGTSEASL